MGSSFGVVGLIEGNELSDGFGNGIYPLYPSLFNREVVDNPGETVLATFKGKKLHVADELLTDKASVRITLTNERIIFEVPRWKWDLNLLDLATVGALQRDAGERLMLAGHVPLECVALLVSDLSKPPMVLIKTMSRIGDESTVMDLMWTDGAPEVERFGIAAGRAIKARWDLHDLPDTLRIAIQDTDTRAYRKKKSLGRSTTQYQYESPAALAIGSNRVFAAFTDADLFDGKPSLELRHIGDKSE